MKKLLVLVIVILMLLTACGPSDEECQHNWETLDIDPDNEALIILQLLEREWPPKTVGEFLQKCIRGGWRP